MTSTRPTRATLAGRIYLDLQNLARRSGRPTDELHQLYALEGFLARLAFSPYANRLILKGGVLLAAYQARRPTRDVDLQGQQIAGDVNEVLDLVRAIAAIPRRMVCPFTPRPPPLKPSAKKTPTAVSGSPGPEHSPVHNSPSMSTSTSVTRSIRPRSRSRCHVCSTGRST